MAIQTVDLTDEELLAVKKIAKLYGAVAQAGRTAGQGSVHHLVRAIASGELLVVPAPPKPEPGCNGDG
jgi:hypothetical protein